jgi:hypothetical protein
MDLPGAILTATGRSERMRGWATGMGRTIPAGMPVKQNGALFFAGDFLSVQHPLNGEWTGCCSENMVYLFEEQ